MSWGRLILFLAAISIVVSTGVAHGLRTNRWGNHGTRGAVEALQRLPMVLGSWSGQTETMDPRAVTGAELDGYLMRRYTNSQSGESVSLLIACGRPGPVSVHTPDVCYLGAGYERTRSGRIKISASDTPGDPIELWWADFDKAGSLPAERVRILWSWSATGDWLAPENPRLVFGLEPFLYKIYVVRRVQDAGAPASDDPGLDFVRQLIPELARSVFGKTGHVPAGSIEGEERLARR